MNKRVFLIMIIIGAVVNNVFSDTYIVPDDSPSIQMVIDLAGYGDTIYIRQGLYRENLFIEGKGLYISSFFSTPGLGNMLETIIDGTRSGSVLYLKDCMDTVTLRGLTICNGLDKYGGGIRCGNSLVKMEDLVIRDNATLMSAPYCGGGIAAATGATLIMNNVQIIGNTAYDHGGGISLRDNSVLSGTNLTISRNICGGGGHCKGGGIYVGEGSSLHLSRSLITGNVATLWGGAVAVADDSFVGLTNATLTGNFAGSGGGALYCCYVESRIFLGNCILAHNQADIAFPRDQEVYFDETGYNNSLAYVSSNIEGGQEGMYIPSHSVSIELEGNIDTVPYVNPDFTLASPSPCIDAGIDYFEYWNQVMINIPANQYCGAAPDMGAFENYNVLVNVPKIPPGEEIFMMVYPNPAGHEVNVVLINPTGKKVTFSLFDSKGIQVMEQNERLSKSGQDTFRLSLAGLTEGSYILKATTKDQLFTAKILH